MTFSHVGFLLAYHGKVSYVQGVARNNHRLFAFVQFKLVQNFHLHRLFCYYSPNRGNYTRDITQAADERQVFQLHGIFRGWKL